MLAKSEIIVIIKYLSFRAVFEQYLCEYYRYRLYGFSHDKIYVKFLLHFVKLIRNYT